jgi:photosystem II stability/assembly factor-like uncharacterized protein
MMIAPSSLSVAANELRTLLQKEIDGLDVGQIKIGHPKDTFEDMDSGNEKDKEHLNLFFYNVQYDGYPADGLSEDPFYVRLNCLITSVAGKSTKPSPGENDLRLVGEVMRVLHQHPMISVDGEDNSEIAQLQIVPSPMNLDNLNHVWSTQGDTAYRLSVAYEMALAPVPMAEAVEKSSLVAETGTEIEGDMDQELLPDSGFGIETFAPIVPKVIVDASKSDWAPHVCFVYLDACTYTLAFRLGSQALTDFVPKIWVAADRNACIDLIWEQWKSDSGWQVVSRRKNIFSIALAMHFGPTDIYAGTNGSAVFRSVDSGENWAQKKAGLIDLNVQFLAIDPGPPATVYAGTNGEGVFKSVDSGENWAQKKKGMNNLNVQFLVIDPGTAATVYAGTNGGGVFKSLDSGEHWTQKKAGLIDLNVQFLAIDPGSPTTVYAGTNGAGVFKSVDSGEHWAQKKTGLSDLNIQFLAIDPDTPAIVYVGTNGGGIFKSVDEGDTWTELSRIPIGLNNDVLTIAPDKADSAETFQESMPDKLSPGQSMLYAVRTSKSMHDGYVTETRSNPLLVTVYEAAT